MISSLTWLMLSTVLSLLGLAFVLIGGVTDNWLEYSVSRNAIYNAVNHNQRLSTQIRDAISHDPLYYSRTYGLFHVCFPEEVPQDIGSFSKFGSPCIFNRDYFPSNVDRYNTVQMQHLWMMRGVVICYIVGVAIIFIGLLVGIMGCYRHSACITKITAYIFMFAAVSLAVSFAVWHFAYYQEHNMLQVHPFYPSWEPFLKQATQLSFGWSYIIFWIGLICCLFAAIALLFSYSAIWKEEHQIYESKHPACYQQYYDKSLVPISYGAPYGNAGYGMYPPSPAAAAYYGPTYGSSYYGYMPYGA